jgi:heme-degrading monooxygenase HmoA
MNEQAITTGTWYVDEAKQAAFVDAWADFACWASSMPGSTTLRLGRDGSDSRRFVSFAAWDTGASANAWTSHPEFTEQLAQVLQHVDDFHSEVLTVVAAAAAATKSVSYASQSAG